MQKWTDIKGLSFLMYLQAAAIPTNVRHSCKVGIDFANEAAKFKLYVNTSSMQAES